MESLIDTAEEIASIDETEEEEENVAEGKGLDF
jgi:hypothetical protein